QCFSWLHIYNHQFSCLPVQQGLLMIEDLQEAFARKQGTISRSSVEAEDHVDLNLIDQIWLWMYSTISIWEVVVEGGFILYLLCLCI
ncbi:hypothetical protein ACJX0J_016109, partial [Zea mays]